MLLRPSRGLLALLIFLPCALVAQGGSDGAAGSRAVTLGSEAFSQGPMVAIGRDLVIDGELVGDASVLRGDALISGKVGGHLIVLEGSATLRSGSHIGGDVVVLGGQLTADPASRVEGRTLVYPTASRAILALAEVPSLGGRAVLLSARIGLLLAWWLAGTLLVAGFAAQVRETGAIVAARPLASFVTGLSFLCASALGLIVLAGWAPALVSLPLLVLVVLAAFVFKVWGTVAVVAALGIWLSERSFLAPRRLDLLAQFLIGLVCVGLIKLTPWVGAVVWSGVTLVGIGASLAHLGGGRR